MNIQQYLDEMKTIQNKLITFIEKEDDIEENFQNLSLIINDQKIQSNKHDLRLFLHFLSTFSNHHHRGPNFFDKIERILQFLKEEILNQFTNQEIFKIFVENKRILLFLIEEKILQFDEDILSSIPESYKPYFSIEIESFTNENQESEINEKDEEKFKEKRRIGENDDKICSLIQKDDIEGFIIYVNKNNYSIKSTIKKSIYETNSFLLDKNPTLIEYAAFFGSIQIFNYLYKNGVEIEPTIWVYAIHSDNTELFSILEDKKVQPVDNSYDECFNESIKCNHLEMANYILENYSPKLSAKPIRYYNFNFINVNFEPENLLYR